MRCFPLLSFDSTETTVFDLVAYQPQMPTGKNNQQDELGAPPRRSGAWLGATLTRASPTPSAKSPVKWSSCDGLWVEVRQRNQEHPVPGAA